MSADAGSWKLTYEASREAVEAALLTHDVAVGFPDDMVIAGRAKVEDTPGPWLLEVWTANKPTKRDRITIANLFPTPSPAPVIEHLADEDWVTLSQAGTDPVAAGRFVVRTPDYAPELGAIDLVIPVGQAFGTGQHETTAGCLVMLDRMRRQGIRVRDALDVGTGTGLLAFATLKLWRHARVTASDIDPVCAAVVAGNARLNGIDAGAGGGQLTTVIADGLADPLIGARGPYDLTIANILAGPLIDLAPGIVTATRPGGAILLAGLLTGQADGVLRAYVRHGCMTVRHDVRGDWAILWLCRSRVR